MGKAAKKAATGGSKKKGDKSDKPPKPARASSSKGTATDQAGQISANKLKRLMSESRAAYQDGRSIAGEIGQKIASAVEHDHLHKKAFAFIRSADRMEPEKLADLLDTLNYYLDISGLNDRASKVMRMDMSDDGKGGDDEGKPSGSTVHPFPVPRGEAAE